MTRKPSTYQKTGEVSYEGIGFPTQIHPHHSLIVSDSLFSITLFPTSHTYIHPTDKERLELTIHALWGSKSGGSTTPFSLSLFLFSFRKMCWGKEKKENARIFIQTNKAATRRNWRTPHTLNLQVKKE